MVTQQINLFVKYLLMKLFLFDKNNQRNVAYLSSRSTIVSSEKNTYSEQ